MYPDHLHVLVKINIDYDNIQVHAAKADGVCVFLLGLETGIFLVDKLEYNAATDKMSSAF